MNKKIKTVLQVLTRLYPWNITPIMIMKIFIILKSLLLPLCNLPFQHFPSLYSCPISREPLVLVSWGCCNNYHKLSALKQQKCILSQVYRPKVWNQDASRATLSRSSRWESILCFFQLLVSSWHFLTCGQLLQSLPLVVSLPLLWAFSFLNLPLPSLHKNTWH